MGALPIPRKVQRFRLLWAYFCLLKAAFFRLFNIFVGVGFYHLFRVRWKMGGKSPLEKRLSYFCGWYSWIAQKSMTLSTATQPTPVFEELSPFRIFFIKEFLLFGGQLMRIVCEHIEGFFLVKREYPFPDSSQVIQLPYWITGIVLVPSHAVHTKSPFLNVNFQNEADS